MSAIVNARPADDSGCGSVSPTVESTMTVMYAASANGQRSISMYPTVPNAESPTTIVTARATGCDSHREKERTADTLSGRR